MAAVRGKLLRWRAFLYKRGSRHIRISEVKSVTPQSAPNPFYTEVVVICSESCKAQKTTNTTFR